MKTSAYSHVAIIGYGEVGKIFARGLAAQGLSVCAWDSRFAVGIPAADQTVADSGGIQLCNSAAAAYKGRSLVISSVTAGNTLAVATEAALHLAPNTLFLDLNSASPGTKKQCAEVMQAAGAHYVEAGVMTSVPPYGIKVPMLLGGAQATDLAAQLNAWGCDATVVATTIGTASAIKMCRSVMIKGMEALVIESFSTARHYGVEAQVIASLQETFPSIDWQQQGSYFFSRVAQHGQRRSEEMVESARTVSEAGIAPTMASAIATKHGYVAQLKRDGVFDAVDKTAPWQAFADAVAKAKQD